LAYLRLAYKGMAASAPKQSFPTIAAAAAWVKSVVEAPGVGLDATQLVAVRKAITADLTAAIGPPNGTTGFDPARFVAELNHIETALQGVK
jgi:hypothetical protein